MAGGGGAATSNLLLAALASLTVLTTATPDFFGRARTAAIDTIATDTRRISANQVNEGIASEIQQELNIEFGKLVFSINGREHERKIWWDVLVWCATEPANPYVDWQTSASGAGGCDIDSLDESEQDDALCAYEGGSFLVRGVNDDSPKLALLIFHATEENVWLDAILNEMVDDAEDAARAHLQASNGSLRGAAALIGWRVSEVENVAGGVVIGVVGRPRAVFICAMVTTVDLGMGLLGGSLLKNSFNHPLAGHEERFEIYVMPA